MPPGAVGVRMATGMRMETGWSLSAGPSAYASLTNFSILFSRSRTLNLKSTFAQTFSSVIQSKTVQSEFFSILK